MTVEYIRSLGEIAFPWNITPLTQANYLYPVQIVSVTGIWGLSFWVAGINALTYIVVKKGRRWFIAPIVWCGIPFVWGFLMLKGAPTADSTLDVALVQGNVDPAGKWANGLIYNLNLYDDLTSDIRASDLVVWPEAAVPTYLESSVRARRTIKHIAQQISAPVFTGALAQDISEEGIEHHYNSAFLIKPDTIKIERYDKVHLVPFGERVPFQGMFPALGNLNLGQAEFTPGKEYRIFHLDSADFAGLICFESIFPQLVRKFVIGGADFLVNITNDGWYGKTAEPYQQALLTRFRAIENSRSIIRCANTGVSYLMDGRGRFIEKSEMETEAILQGKIPLYNNETFYTKYGDVFALTIVSITIILMLFIGKQCI
jgi:apolipoprotein N-acyltransferase